MSGHADTIRHFLEVRLKVEWPNGDASDSPESVTLAALDALVAENQQQAQEIDYLRVRMLVAVSFMDSDIYDKFTEHTAGIDAKHKALAGTPSESPVDPDTGLPISGWGIDHDRSHPPVAGTPSEDTG